MNGSWGMVGGAGLLFLAIVACEVGREAWRQSRRRKAMSAEERASEEAERKSFGQNW